MYYQDDRHLAFRLARLFEGAKIEGEPGQWPTTIVLADGTALHIQVAKGRGHVSLSLSGLAAYLRTYGRDADIVPATSFDLARPDEAIARQILRSVILPGAKLLAILRQRKQDDDDYISRKHSLTNQIAEALGETPCVNARPGTNETIYAKWPDGENWRITAEIRTDDSVHFVIDANLEQALRLARAIRSKATGG